MDEATEKSLVTQVIRGDTGAFGRLIDSYQKPLFNTAYRMLGNAEDARDVTQTAFVKAFEKLATYDPHYRFFSWIYKILVNEARNLLGRRKPVESLLPDLVSEGKSPEEECHDTLLADRVRTAILGLSPDLRVVIVLRYFGDLSYREMSYVLDIPEKTVKSRLFTARRRLGGIVTRQGMRK